MPVTPGDYDDPAARLADPNQLLNKPPLIGHVFATLQRPKEVKPIVFEWLLKRIRNLETGTLAQPSLICEGNGSGYLDGAQRDSHHL